MKVIFLDRDGVINCYPGDTEYVKSWSEFQFLPGVKQALKKLHERGSKIFIISNQAGVAKGIYSQKNLNEITQNMLQELKRDAIAIEGVYYCTHRSEDNCACRKPKTGLIDMALAKLKKQESAVDFEKSYFIGDTMIDVETGKVAGVKTILVFSGKEKPENRHSWKFLPDFTAVDLSGAVDFILKS